MQATLPSDAMSRNVPVQTRQEHPFLCHFGKIKFAFIESRAFLLQSASNFYLIGRAVHVPELKLSCIFSRKQNYFGALSSLSEGGFSPPKNFGQLRFFGRKEKFGKSQSLKMFSSFCFMNRQIFSIFKSKSALESQLNPHETARGCLARDALLVISKGDHKLMYIFLFFSGGGGEAVGRALYCTALTGVVN